MDQRVIGVSILKEYLCGHIWIYGICKFRTGLKIHCRGADLTQDPEFNLAIERKLSPVTRGRGRVVVFQIRGIGGYVVGYRNKKDAVIREGSKQRCRLARRSRLCS